MKKNSTIFAATLCLQLIAFSSQSQTLCLSYEAFTATKSSSCAVTLAWTYQQCIDGVFYVQYSVNGGVNWYNIGVVNSTGSIGTEQSYTFVDNYACPGNSTYPNAYYRLYFVKGGGAGIDVSIVKAVGFSGCSCSQNNTTRCNNIPTISISGAEAICTGTSQTYTLSSGGYGVTWSITSGSSLVSVTGSDPTYITLANNTSNGMAVLTANLEGCRTISKNIQIGVPYWSGGMYGWDEPNPCVGSNQIVQLNPLPAPAPIDWSVTSSPSPYDYWIEGSGESAEFGGFDAGEYDLMATAHMGCGDSYAYGSTTLVYCFGNRMMIPNNRTAQQTPGKPGPITIYPNPVRSSFTVSAPGSSINEIRIYDMLGALRMDVKPGNSQQALVSVNSLSSGVYIVNIYHDKTIERKKITVQK